MPRVLPVLTVAALAVALVGCAADEPDASTSTDDTTSSDECATSGPASDAVDVAGEFGVAPTVSFDTPVEVETTQRTVVAPGDGKAVERGSTVTLQFTLYNGSSGEVVTQTDYTSAAESITVDGLLPGLESTLLCTPVGSRVVGVVPASEGFGDAGSSQLGVAPGQPLVFVLDVVSLIPSAAEAMTEWTTDVPEVTRADDGTPTVTLPDVEPPADLMLTVLSEGDGAVVADGDSVTVNYQGISWNTGEIFDESFSKSPATFVTTGVVPGFAAALVGQKVGSTVLVTIPPIYAYGTDPSAAALGGQTLVFLIDIEDAATS